MASKHTHGRKVSPSQPHTPLLLNRAFLLGAGGTVLILVLLLTLLVSGQTREEMVIQPAPGGPAIIAPESEMIQTSGTGAPLPVGAEAPDFRFTMPDGSTRSLSDLQGQKVLINFWATWCPPCRAEMPEIEAAARDYADEGLVVLAVNREEEQAAIEQFVRAMGLSFTVITNEAGDISTTYGARGLPMTYFINSDGTIHYRHAGVIDKSFIEQRLMEMQ